MFAILGINLLKGKLNYCSLPLGSELTEYDLTKELCDTIPGAEWKLRDMNMEHIGYAMISLFISSTNEGWPGYMFEWIDGSENGVVKDN